jgi:hypothetical protein
MARKRPMKDTGGARRPTSSPSPRFPVLLTVDEMDALTTIVGDVIIRVMRFSEEYGWDFERNKNADRALRAIEDARKAAAAGDGEAVVTLTTVGNVVGLDVRSALMDHLRKAAAEGGEQ